MAGEGVARPRARTTTTTTLLLCLLFVSAALLLLGAPAAAEAKGLDVTLKARWEATSFVLEAAEFLVS